MGIYDDNIKDYDKNGNWKRDYLNLDIPIDELALPRNEKEQKLFDKRYDIETDNDADIEWYASLPFSSRTETCVEGLLENCDLTEKEKEVVLNEQSNY